MKANFVTTFENGTPVLPPLEAENDGDLHLTYLQGGQRVGGFACISYAPDQTVIVQVHASPDTIAAMKADDAYVWLEDLPNA